MKSILKILLEAPQWPRQQKPFLVVFDSAHAEEEVREIVYNYPEDYKRFKNMDQVLNDVSKNIQQYPDQLEGTTYVVYRVTLAPHKNIVPLRKIIIRNNEMYNI